MDLSVPPVLVLSHVRVRVRVLPSCGSLRVPAPLLRARSTACTLVLVPLLTFRPVCDHRSAQPGPGPGPGPGTSRRRRVTMMVAHV